MTTPSITDAWIAEQLALAEAAMPQSQVSPALLSGPEHGVTLWMKNVGGVGGKTVTVGQIEITKPELDFIFAARNGYPAALQALAETRATLREIIKATWWVAPDSASSRECVVALNIARRVLGEEEKP